MSDIVVYIPFHGYSNSTSVYVSWLNDVFFVADKNSHEFKLTTSAGGATYIQWTEDITEGYIREVDSTSGVTTIIGLDHLEGEDVYVTSGGEVVGVFTVESSSVTVPNILFTYQVGKLYVMKVRTMRHSIPQEGTTIQTRIKRIERTTIRYIRSSLGMAGQEYDGVEYLQPIGATFSTEAQDTKPDNRLSQGGFSEDAYTIIISDDPVPFTGLASIIDIEVEK